MEQDLRDPRQRVLDAAEALFLERGYTAITLRDIADDLGLKQASLYYHFPEGKEQLFMTMSERLFDRHAHGLNAAMAAAEPGQTRHRWSAQSARRRPHSWCTSCRRPLSPVND